MFSRYMLVLLFKQQQQTNNREAETAAPAAGCGTGKCRQESKQNAISVGLVKKGTFQVRGSKQNEQITK